MAAAPTPPAQLPAALPAMIASQLAAIHNRGPTVPIEVKDKDNNWSSFTLADGSIVRVRLELQNVLREIGKYNPSGQPTYHFSVGVNMTLIAPPELMEGYRPKRRIKTARKRKKK